MLIYCPLVITWVGFLFKRKIMSIVQPYIDQLNSIKKDIPNIAKQAIKDNSAEIVLLVKHGQLSKGLNEFGLPLEWSGGTGKYAESTQSYADRDGISMRKQKDAPYNFSWTGQTLDNMKLGKISKETYEVTTIAYKVSLLEGIYGEIFKLTKEHNDFVNNEIIPPALINHILNNFMRV